jgi:hypothetical protein
MTDSFDTQPAFFDVELARVLTACRNEDHHLTDSESRSLAAAFAQQDTPLANWGAGIDVAHTARLFTDTRRLLDAASILADDTRTALCALAEYFRDRARVLPTRADYEHELIQIYAREIEFLRARGHTPYIARTGLGGSCTGLAASLNDKHELYATNGDACLVDSETEERPGPWSVDIYEIDTGHAATDAVHPCFATAYADAVAALPRPRARTPLHLLRRIATALHLHRKRTPPGENAPASTGSLR